MRVSAVWLENFRNYKLCEIRLPREGWTALVGENGAGKTNLLEAIGYLDRLSSFRGASKEAMIRQGCCRAVVRAETNQGQRELLIEVGISAGDSDRVMVNRQPLKNLRELIGTVRTSVFSPDDLNIVKGGPGERRRFLDDTLVSLAPRYDRLRRDLERSLRQRSSLLRQAAGRLSPEVYSSLDVWDSRVAEFGEEVASARQTLANRLQPLVRSGYGQLSKEDLEVEVSYEPSWEGSLLAALGSVRGEDLRRGVSTLGPHRDELSLALGSLAGRTHASRGEQRCLALALRLAAHELVTSETGESPVLLLDDVFSELDRSRASALIERLPMGQALLATTGPLPPSAEPEEVLKIDGGKVFS